MTIERIGDWMQTISGIQFYPLDPRPEEITIEDIAHGLAFSTRFNGHTSRFYSIAEHSLYVSYQCDPADAIEGLCHDAAEAYVGDVVRPLKRSLPGFADIEARVERAIAERFGLRFPWPPSVKRADDAVLFAERRDLLAPPPRPWSEPAEPMTASVVGYSPERAREMFLERYHELQAARAA